MSDAEERVILMEMLANARADVAHTMAELARVTAGRDVLAVEVGALVRDLMTAINERDAAIRERDAYKANCSRSVLRRLAVQLKT